MDEFIEKVRVAAADKESAQFQLDNAAADLLDLIREALNSGVPAADLTDPSGLTLKQIRRICGHTES